MFTGITREMGIAGDSRKTSGSSLYRLEIISDKISLGSGIGDSVSVNGVCLTVAAKRGGTLYFDVTEETMRRTNLANLKRGDRVNLEDSLKANGALAGHFVLGHIDCVGKVNDICSAGKEFSVKIEFPPSFNRLVVEKGSVAIDGVSLTVGRVSANLFTVYLIPHTLKATTFGFRKKGDSVNIEFDIIGKFVARFMAAENSSGISESFLRDKGFI